MCGVVYLSDVVDGDGHMKSIDTPNDLRAAGVPIEVDDGFDDACWCCSDPTDAMRGAGYVVYIDRIWSDLYGVRPSEPAPIDGDGKPMALDPYPQVSDGSEVGSDAD